VELLGYAAAIVSMAILAMWIVRAASHVKLRVTVHDFEAGLLYHSGRLRRVLPPGGHWLMRPFSRVQLLDLRMRVVTVPAQEVLTSDNVSVKASLLLRYRVARPEVAVNTAASFEEALYAEAQLILRGIVGGLAVEELVQGKDALGSTLEERLGPKAETLGLALESAGIKDLIFPPLLRQVFHQVVEARKASQASLERARGETATLRSLANAARMLENNPALLALKTLQTAADGKHTLVLGAGGPILPFSTGGPPVAPLPPPAPAPEDRREAA
jgi:regulator of protease activity HflC (stomatin/prohibitin superfamily)